MPKKPTSNRLNKIFEDINKEPTVTAKKTARKTPARPAERKPAVRASAKINTGPLAPETAIVFASSTPPASQQNVTVAQSGFAGHPASMSLAFQMDRENWATLHVVDEVTPRAWGENDQLMVRQVTDQLSLALESARLFQETRLRAEELSILNEIGRELPTLFTADAIAEAIYRGASRLMDTTNLFVSLYNAQEQEITPIFVINNRERVQVSSRKLGNGLTDYILRAHQPLFIPQNIPARMMELGLEVVALGNNRPAQSWLGVPLLAGNSVLGVIGVQSVDIPNLYTEHHRDLLSALSSQAALALQNATLFKEVQSRAEEQIVLNELGRVLAAQLDVNQVLKEIYGGVARLLDARNFFIGLYDQERNTVSFPLNATESAIDQEVVTIRADQGMTGYILRTKQPLLVAHSLEEWMLDHEIDVVGEPAKSWLGAPLLLGDRVIGLMAVQNYSTPQSYNEHDRDLMLAFSYQAAIAIENARLFNEARRRNDYLAATAEIGRLVTSTLDLPTLFSRTVNLVRDRFGFYHAGIFINEETGFSAVLQAATGEAGAEMKNRAHSLPVGSLSIVGEVTETGRAVVVNDTRLSDVHKPNPLLPDTVAEAAIPLRIGSRTIGALDIQSTFANAFTENDIAVLQTLGDQVAIAIDNARSYELSIQAVKEMREADRLKSQFLANMSHELRTPLNSIIGFSRVILKGIDGPTTDLQQQDLLAIHNSGQHLLGLINDILDLSRIEAGKMELTFDEVNLSELISGVITTVSGLIKDKPITLQREVMEDLPPVRADAMRIRQVLLNLLSNATKFTETGTITVKTTPSVNSAGHTEITISITDTGTGISLEDQKKLFQPFSQVDASLTRKSGGSGLGLSISNHLVQMHGGQIGVQSAPGAGSTFYFTLPAYRSKVQISGSSSNRVILAVDDDPQVISLYERYLQPQGYQVIPLSDPSRAMERARQLKPFAITLDIMMPGYDGWRVLNDLKTDPETRDIPVVICSIVEDQERGFSLGASDYLIKPIIEDDLIKILERLNSDGSIREVLIIDDDPNDLRLINRMFAEHGRYHAVTAEGGKNGWDAILARPPHAIIMDLFMPDMDGFTLLEKLQTSKTHSNIPVIIVSGADLTPEQNRQLHEFGQSMLQKNTLTERQLLDDLERVLKRAGQQKK